MFGDGFLRRVDSILEPEDEVYIYNNVEYAEQDIRNIERSKGVIIEFTEITTLEDTKRRYLAIGEKRVEE